MKSDQVQRRSKERVKEVREIRASNSGEIYGETWAISDLCAFNTLEISDARDLLAIALAKLAQSNAAKTMMREAGEQGWRVGLASLEHHDFHLDVPEKLIIIDNNGLAPVALARALYFYNSLQISLTRALRDVWQEKRHGGFDVHYVPESVLLLERVRAADCDVMTVLVGWEMRSMGDADLWRHIIGSEDGDVAEAFVNYLERDASALQSGKALSAAFRQWFRAIPRINTCDHETLEYMDDVIAANPGAAAFGKKRAGKICVEVLSCLPDKTAYLKSQGDEILCDPLFAGLCEPINQSHFMHIMRDAQSVLVQNVPFRDAGLAAKIFPNGEMTPGREDVTQKS